MKFVFLKYMYVLTMIGKKCFGLYTYAYVDISVAKIFDFDPS